MEPRPATLRTLAQVKALAAPLRVRILRAVAEQPLTAKQIAEQLGEPPTRLYHHVAALARAGLVELVETRPKRGAQERYYRAVARAFAVDHALLSMTPPGSPAAQALQAVFAGALEAAAAEVRASVAAGLLTRGNRARRALLAHTQVRGSPDEIQAVLRRLRACLETCQRRPGKRSSAAGQDEQEYSLTVAFYPVRKPRPATPPPTP